MTSPRAFALIGWLVASMPAVAAAADPRAAESFRQARAAYERSDFAAAASAFELAAEFEPNARVLLDAATAWMRADQPVRAAEDCDRALAMKDVPEDARAYALEQLAELGNRVATLDVTGPATVSVVVDDGPEAHAPLHKRMAPGHHLVRITDLVTGSRSLEDIDLQPGVVRHLEAPAAPQVAPVPQPPVPQRPPREAPPSRTRGVPAGAWVGAGAAAVAVGVASVFGVMTLHAKSDFDQTPTQGSSDAFYRDRAISNVAWGVALIGATAALIAWIAR